MGENVIVQRTGNVSSSFLIKILIVLLLGFLMSFLGGKEARTEVISGGSTVNTDNNAPKEIQSQKLIHFDLECNFNDPKKKYAYVYGYATKVDGGALVGLAYHLYGKSDPNSLSYSELSHVSEEVFQELDKLSRDHKFASKNGYSYFTAGIMDIYGGYIKSRYESGEEINIRDNQHSVISAEAAEEMVEILKKYIYIGRVSEKDPIDIYAVSLKDETDQFTYEKYFIDSNRLTVESKSGKNQELYKKEYTLPVDMLYKVRKLARENWILYWQGMRQSDQKDGGQTNKQIVFTLRDGTEITASESDFAPKTAKNSIQEIQTVLKDLKKDAESGFSRQQDFLPPAKEEIDYEKAYGYYLDAIYHQVKHGQEEIDYIDLPLYLHGVAETAAKGDMLDKIGYTFRDLNQDGIQELLVGINEGNEYLPGTRLLNVFYLDEIESKVLLSGGYRDAWYLLSSGDFYTNGSAGAAYSVEGVYHFSPSYYPLSCKSMYFTAPTRADGGIEWYFNSKGLDSVNSPDTVKVSESDYLEFNTAQRSNLVQLELTPLSRWGISHIKVEDFSKLSNPPEDYILYADEEGEGTVKVLISGQKEIIKFSWLDVRLNHIDEAGKPHYTVVEKMSEESMKKPMLTEVKFPEYSSNRGFSCSDRYGDKVYYHLYMSGKDGSLQLERFVP